MSDYASSPSRPASPVAPPPDLPTVRPSAYRFNWDPASRRPGPGSVSETTEGRGDYFSTTPKVDIYGASSSAASLQLNTVPSQWSSAKHGFHGRWYRLLRPWHRLYPRAHAAQPFPPSLTTPTRNPLLPKPTPLYPLHRAWSFHVSVEKTLTLTSVLSDQNGKSFNVI
jgi:vacuolar protein sorting-associated protein 54